MPENKESEDVPTKIALLTGRKEEYAPLTSNHSSLTKKIFQNHPYYSLTTKYIEFKLSHYQNFDQSNFSNPLLKIFEPDIVIVSGTAGGLKSDISVGEVFLPTSVLDPNYNHWIYPDIELIQWFFGLNEENFQEQTRTGPLLTTNEPVIKKSKKKQIHKQTDAMAVDMETYSIVSKFNSLNTNDVTWMSLRIISDNLNNTSMHEVKNNQNPAIDQLQPHLEKIFDELISLQQMPL